MITDMDMTARRATVPEDAAGTGRRLTSKRLTSAGISIALLAAIGWYVAPNLPDVSTVWGHVRAMSGTELAILAAVAAWNLATYWMVMVAATPGLTYGQAMVATQSSTAVANTIPGGSAISVGLTYAMLGSWGFSKSRSTVSLVVAGIWNNFVKLGMPVLALALLAFQGEASGSRILAGTIGIASLVAAVALFAFILRSADFAERAGERAGRMAAPVRRVMHRGPADGWGRATLRFRDRVIGLVRHSWIRLTITSLVGHFSLFLVLLVILRDIGVSQDEVSWTQALAVFAFVRLLTAVPLMPGGLGIVELGLIGGLTAAGGDKAEVVAAVLVYRTLTYLVPIAFGIATYLFWRRNESWLDTAPPLDAALSPAPAQAR
ncbi:MAG: flippase-like domain-containing protein [Actinomycetota bacterium]|nr:flippase-like domain-containing protein [Actinomycetota bacterium]